MPLARDGAADGQASQTDSRFKAQAAKAAARSHLGRNRSSVARAFSRTQATISNNRPALLPYLKRDGDDSNDKDYDKPGEFGKYANAHVAYVWLREKNDKSYWKQLSLKKFYECETIVFEAQYREVNVQCPPDDGFATIVRLAEKKATDMITLYECPDVCGGSYFYTSYRKWFCQENDVVVIVQVTRQCYVT